MNKVPISIATMKAKKEQAISEAAISSKSMHEAKLRKINAEASKTEVQVMRELRELVLVDDVIRTMCHEYASVKQRLLMIPSRLAPLLVSEDNEQEIRRLLLEEITIALSELSEGTYDGPQSIIESIAGHEGATTSTGEDDDIGVGGQE